MDDDLERKGRVEVGLFETGQVVVLEHLGNLPVLLGVEEQLGPNLLWWGGQHVQVVERALVAEATQVPVAHDLFIAAVTRVANAF